MTRVGVIDLFFSGIVDASEERPLRENVIQQSNQLILKPARIVAHVEYDALRARCLRLFQNGDRLLGAPLVKVANSDIVQTFVEDFAADVDGLNSRAGDGEILLMAVPKHCQDN